MTIPREVQIIILGDYMNHIRPEMIAKNHGYTLAAVEYVIATRFRFGGRGVKINLT